MLKMFKYNITCLIGLYVFSSNILFCQDLAADLLRNNGIISARINKYEPSRYNYLIDRKSVE